MFKLAAPILILMMLSCVLMAQNTNNRPAWDVTLKANTTAPSTLTVQNRCKKQHEFEIQPQNVSFLEISQKNVKVGGGANVAVPVRFNTTGLSPQKYEGQVLVICLTCSKEPTCTQDREVLPVILNVPADSATNAERTNESDPVKVSDASDKSKNPCDRKCEDLLSAANSKEAAATKAQDAADKKSDTADTAEKDAKDAEEASKRADEAAEDDPSDYRARVNEQKYSSADVAYRLKLQSEINAAQKAGQISNKEHERRTKKNTTKNARKERLKNKEKLKKEAEKAKAKADAARKAANEAKAAAEAAQKAADAAREAADAAKRAYDECIRKSKDECEKLKAAQAKKEADAKAAEDLRIAEEKRASDLRVAEERERKERIEENKRLLELIKKLGLINKKISDVPSIWQWLPDWLETPVGVLAEAVSSTPVPTDSLKAIGGLYGLAGQMLNPCNDAAAKPRLIAKLNKMINPKTGRVYSDSEALDEIKRMCDLMGRMKTKLQGMRK